MTANEMTAHENDVHLVGRLAAAAEARDMPSGDQAVVWRLVVDRAAPDTRGRVDTVACVAWAAGARRSALRWHAGDILESTARCAAASGGRRVGRSAGMRWKSAGRAAWQSPTPDRARAHAPVSLGRPCDDGGVVGGRRWAGRADAEGPSG